MQNNKYQHEVKFCKFTRYHEVKTVTDWDGYYREKKEIPYDVPCIFHMFFIETIGTFQDYDYPVKTTAKAIIEIEGSVHLIEAEELTFINEKEYKKLKNAQIQTGNNLAGN